MQFFTFVKALIFGMSIYALSAYATPRGDWKTRVGWDGITLPASSVGIPIAASSLASRSVCYCSRIELRHTDVPRRLKTSVACISVLTSTGAAVVATRCNRSIRASCSVVTGISKYLASAQISVPHVSVSIVEPNGGYVLIIMNRYPPRCSIDLSVYR